MAWEGFSPDMKVIIAGAIDGQITKDGHGSQEFEDLAEAIEVFPDLDPKANTKRLPWATKHDDMARFDTWASYNVLSG